MACCSLCHGDWNAKPFGNKERGVCFSRWVDYDTRIGWCLLLRIEDERREGSKPGNVHRRAPAVVLHITRIVGITATLKAVRGAGQISK